MAFTRGFTGKRRGDRAVRGDRLPPGQYDTGRDWPTLTAEATPQLTPEQWSITVDGLVEEQHTWSWREAQALPGSTYDGDIHCVTTWSKFDMSFRGVSVDTLLDAARPRPEAAFVMAHSSTGYTTNLPHDPRLAAAQVVERQVGRRPATRPTCRSTTCAAERRGSCGRSTARR